MEVTQRDPSARLFLAACFLPLLLVARAEADALPTGRVIEKVICQADPQQSYALYLPAGYTPSRRWPVLYCYDSAARGRLPVERFREGAERFGYIVAGSLNSRNGPWEPTAAAIKAMWEDTHARFSIEDSRVYATGFSGGARVACRVAGALKGLVAGVIACGAGFPPDLPPSESMTFAFFGTVGVDDFNFPEMRNIDERLDALRIPNRVVMFEGGHEWAPPALCVEALEWMEIQAIKTAKRAGEGLLVDQSFKRQADKARALEQAHKLYEAYLLYSAIATDFRGLKDVAELEKKATELSDSKEIKQAIKKEKDQIKKQQARAQELVTLARGLLEPESRELAFSDLRRAIAELRNKSNAAVDSDERRVARRALRQVFAEIFEAAEFRYRDNHRLAAVNLEVAAEITPDNPHLLYRLACAHSAAGDKRRAIDALKRAVEKGFTDLADLDANRALDPIRNEEAYKRITDPLRNKP